MQLQPFFNQAPSIQLYDPLAQFLGATPDGVLECHYADAVKLCGHSCPTVASAWLMVIKALAALYSPDELPERGNIEISMSGERDAGVTGVIASVAQLITGAAPETGFGGIGMAGRFARRNLLSFGAGGDADMTVSRRDTGKAVRVTFNGSVVPFAPEMREIMPQAVAGMASPEELQRFGELWQARVHAILVEQVDNPEMIVVEAVV